MNTEPTSPVDFESARAQFLEGLAHFEDGAFVLARAAFDASLQLMPGRPSTLINLAATLLRLDEPEMALLRADAVLAQDVDAVEAWLHRADALARLSRHDEALMAFNEVHARDAAHAVAWTGRGHALRETGQLVQAAEAFRRAIEHGGDAALNRHYLSAVSQASDTLPTSAHPPRAYVEALFDGYAHAFDDHLTKSLGYDTHERLVRLLLAQMGLGLPGAATGTGVVGTARARVLDLGCGTGLAGAHLRPHAQRLVGLDLSSGMLAKARERAVYDELVHDDAAAWLARTDEAFDAVVATDVFIYVGDLSDVFAGVQRALARAASAARLQTADARHAFTHLAFTLECPADLHDGFRLMPNLRYAHSLAYVRALAQAHGFTEIACEPAIVRHEQGQAVPGYDLVLRGPHTGGGDQVPQYVR